jgi:hypothetical protein
MLLQPLTGGVPMSKESGQFGGVEQAGRSTRQRRSGVPGPKWTKVVAIVLTLLVFLGGAAYLGFRDQRARLSPQATVAPEEGNPAKAGKQVFENRETLKDSKQGYESGAGIFAPGAMWKRVKTINYCFNRWASETPAGKAFTIFLTVFIMVALITLGIQAARSWFELLDRRGAA